MSKKFITLATTLNDLVDLSLKLEGEEDEILPVYEYVGKVSMETSYMPSDAVTVDSWYNTDRKHLVSRTPTELLFVILQKEFGDEWFFLEHEVLIVYLHSIGFLFDEGGLNKVMALKLLCEAPEEKQPFYTDPEAFRWMVRALVGQEGFVGDATIPSVRALCIGCYVAFEIRPGSYNLSVRAMIASICIYRGIWALPSYIDIAQDEIYSIAKDQYMDIDAEKVAKVKSLVEAERKDDTTIPDEPDSEEEIQALHVLDVEERTYRAISKADKLVEEFLDGTS